MSDYKLALLYAHWCHYCKRFNPKDGDNGDNVTWNDVKKKVKIDCVEFEEGDLDKLKDEYDMESIKEAVQGWPTVLMLVKVNGKYKPHSYFEGNRQNIDDFNSFISSVVEGKKPILSGGGISMVNKYRNKYKKYKNLYADLMLKYKNLKMH